MIPGASGASLYSVLFAGGLALAPVPGLAQSAGDSASASLTEQAISILSKQSFSIGVSYSQATFKHTPDEATGRTEITDNGAVTPTVDFNSSEKLLKSWPMKVGSIVVGWDIRGTASYFDTHYQLLNSAFRGDDVGTKVTGAYLGVAPSLFLKLGPLYPGSDIYWKVGWGLGPGLLQAKGTALYPDGTTRDVGSSSPKLALYGDAYWQLDVGRWRFQFSGKVLSHRNEGPTSLESYGFGVAYNLLH